MEEQARLAGVAAPSTLVIGAVVATGEGLDWFEKRPLLGKRILVTRAGGAGELFVQTAVELGADVFSFPTIAIVEPESFDPLDAALSQLSDYDWLLFTSSNALAPFRERLLSLGKDMRALGECQIGVVGESTAAALREYGIKADLIPNAYHGEGLLEALRQQGSLSGKRFLLPRALSAREVLPEGIREAGGVVDVVTAYQTVVPPNADLERLEAWFSQGDVPVVTLMSSSAARNLVSMLGGGEKASSIMAGSVFACISEVTAQTMTELGFDSEIVAEEHTARGL